MTAKPRIITTASQIGGAGPVEICVLPDQVRKSE